MHIRRTGFFKTLSAPTVGATSVVVVEPEAAHSASASPSPSPSASAVVPFPTTEPDYVCPKHRNLRPLFNSGDEAAVSDITKKVFSWRTYYV